MKPFSLLALITVTITAASGIAGAVSANEMAEKAFAKIESEAAQKEEVANLAEISAEDLQKLIDADVNLVIVDSRKPSDFAQGHIPGSISLTADEATPERLAALAPSKNAALVFYCGDKQCPASGKTAYKAMKAGYTNIYKYANGVKDWKAKGLPVVTE